MTCSLRVTITGYREELERQLRSDELYATVESHLAKYHRLIRSRELLIHFAEVSRGSVPQSCLEKAIGWGRYLEPMPGGSMHRLSPGRCLRLTDCS